MKGSTFTPRSKWHSEHDDSGEHSLYTIDSSKVPAPHRPNTTQAARKQRGQALRVVSARLRAASSALCAGDWNKTRRDNASCTFSAPDNAAARGGRRQIQLFRLTPSANSRQMRKAVTAALHFHGAFCRAMHWGKKEKKPTARIHRKPPREKKCATKKRKLQ